jgi:ankyrin repeat protein
MNKPLFTTFAFRAIAILVVLAWGALAFGDEIAQAIFNRNTEEVKTLLKEKPDLVFETNKVGSTPLFFAVSMKQAETVKLLLAYKADVNAKDPLGATPLHYVAMDGDRDVGELLLTNKADVNARDKKEETPLHWAALVGRDAMAELLLAYKADVKAKDKNGQTPLHYAAQYGDKKMVELLLAKGAEVNARDNAGHTPLYSAASFRSPKEVQELFEEAKASTNNPPTTLVIGNARDEVAKLLLLHGGEE